MHMSHSYTMHSKEEVHRDISKLVIILHHLPLLHSHVILHNAPSLGMSCSLILPETDNFQQISAKRIFNLSLNFGLRAKSCR